jgi:hypothetical protein
MRKVRTRAARTAASGSHKRKPDANVELFDHIFISR